MMVYFASSIFNIKDENRVSEKKFSYDLRLEII